MTTAGLPPLGPPESETKPEAKLDPARAVLRAARPKPARYNGRIAALLAGGTALVVAGVIFAPALIGQAQRPKPRAPAAGVSRPAQAPIEAITYGAAPADPATGASGMDCSQYPGMPSCAATTAAAVAAPASPASAPAPGGASTPAGASAPIPAAPRAELGASAPSSTGASGASGIFFAGQAAGSGATQSPQAGASAQPQTPSPPFSPSLSPTPVGLAPPVRETARSEAQTSQGEKAAFLRAAAASPDYVEARLQAPRSPYEIKAGAVIPAALLTAINSDLPGEVIAQVTQPVYDHVTGRCVLIPQGARLIGRYDAQVAYGQSRALIVWRRLIFPNGTSLDLGSMAGADPTGAAGLADRVNDHFGQLAKGIVLSTLLSMGVASAQDAQARSSGAIVLNAGASGAANEAQSVGARLTSRDLNRQPTLEIRQGAEVRVLVDKDLILEPYT